jgi:hypothetical protein
MKADGYTKGILTVIAVLLLWLAVQRQSAAHGQVSVDEVSGQVASVGGAVDQMQQSVDTIDSEVSDLKTQVSQSCN